MHVTLRVALGLPSLRGRDVYARIERALRAASRDSFRLVQYSVQSDHLHLVVEADTPTRLARGMQGLAVRTAKAINRVLRRHGTVWAERYHAHALKTPREVRNALVYVLNNFRKHIPGARGLIRTRRPRGSQVGARLSTPIKTVSPIVPARTWLGAVGWRRRGLIDVNDMPRRMVRRLEGTPGATSWDARRRRRR